MIQRDTFFYFENKRKRNTQGRNRDYLSGLVLNRLGIQRRRRRRLHVYIPSLGRRLALRAIYLCCNNNGGLLFCAWIRKPSALYSFCLCPLRFFCGVAPVPVLLASYNPRPGRMPGTAGEGCPALFGTRPSFPHRAPLFFINAICSCFFF